MADSLNEGEVGGGADAGVANANANANSNGDAIYRNDSLRLCSYRNWPNKLISRESLAIAGFYYIGGVLGETTDRVRCAWCSGEIDNWLSGICPITEHLRHFPNCLYARQMADKNSITLSESCNNDDFPTLGNSTELTLDVHTHIFKSMYSSFQSRLDSFQYWPNSHPQKPESLAAAGFYYIGKNDEVRCFHCNVGLSRWEPNDDPWVEHAKYFPQCDYLLLKKGREFIENPRREIPTNANGNENTNNGIRISHTVTDADVENFMASPCAIVALHCGVQADRIRKAIRTRLRRTGIPFSSPENLMDAALNVQINETPFNLPAPIPTQIPSSSRRGIIDEAEIDLVTRMIINSALTGDDHSISNSRSANVQEMETSTPPQIINNEIENLTELTAENQMVDNNYPNSDKDTVSNCDNSQVMNSSLTLEEENKLLKDARMCKICMDAEVGMVFLPCGHLVSCIMCAKNLIQCPICRSSVKGIVRTYLS